MGLSKRGQILIDSFIEEVDEHFFVAPTDRDFMRERLEDRLYQHENELVEEVKGEIVSAVRMLDI